MTSFRPAQALSRVAVSPILALSRRAAELRRSGRDVIDMTVGEPDFDTPRHIQDAAVEAMRRGQTRYTALPGTEALVSAIAAKASCDFGRAVKPEEVIASTGAKQAIYNALAASLDAGDEVVLPMPCWASYGDMVRMAGGEAVAAAGVWNPDLGWRLDPAAIADAITPRTRWLFLNSPSNPSGAVAAADDLREVTAVLRRHPHVWILSDDIYEHFVFGDGRAPHLLDAAPELADRLLSINGVSKAYAMTGWRLGWGVGPTPLIRAMLSVQSQVTSAPSSISQAAAVAALEGPQDSVEGMRRTFEARQARICSVLQATPGLQAPAPQGAFYVFPSVRGVLGARTPAGAVLTDDLAVSAYLLDEADVATVPGSAFGAPGWLRLSYALADAALDAGGGRIAKALTALQRD